MQNEFVTVEQAKTILKTDADTFSCLLHKLRPYGVFDIVNGEKADLTGGFLYKKDDVLKLKGKFCSILDAGGVCKFFSRGE
ncbi:MAG: hypothetical protein U0586_15290 [Candidatus Brocadiaceae bacterium]